MTELDRIDRNILTLLQADCSVTNVQLAEQVGLSPPACLKRVKRLTEEGYITRQVALVAPQKLGSMLHMVVEVFMERDHKQLFQDFAKKVQATLEVKQSYQVTGEDEFVIIVHAQTMEHMSSIKMKFAPYARLVTSMIIKKPIDGRVISLENLPYLEDD